MNENQGAAVFHHPRSIQSGFGRVLYTASQTTPGGEYLPEGWALPGGRRTADPLRAQRVAEEIDRMTRGVQ